MHDFFFMGGGGGNVSPATPPPPPPPLPIIAPLRLPAYVIWQDRSMAGWSTGAS